MENKKGEGREEKEVRGGRFPNFQSWFGTSWQLPAPVSVVSLLRFMMMKQISAFHDAHTTSLQLVTLFDIATLVVASGAHGTGDLVLCCVDLPNAECHHQD